MYKKIVVGIDGSDHALRALNAACGIAKLTEGEICLVHTPQPETVAFAMGAMGELGAISTLPSDAEVFQSATRIVNEARKIAVAEGVRIVEMKMDGGDPADQIVAAARDRAADLIVTGRRGLGAVGSFMLGSTSHKIARTATCACLTVV